MADPPHVLIVEDDPGIALMLEVMLVADGCSTETISDGNDALDRLTGAPPDLAVLDVMLPHTDGLNILRTLRANETWSEVPVMLVTARASREDIRDGWSAGADSYLIKPFDISELRATVRRLLDGDAVG